MPTYRYRCESCGDEFEEWQSITDDALSTHDASIGDGSCAGHLVKVLSPAGIVLKGSGFYKTDSRSGRSAAKNGDGTPDSDSKKSDQSSDSKGDASSGSSGSSGSGSSDSGSSDSSPSESSSSESSGSSGSKDGSSRSGDGSSGSGAKPSKSSSSSS